MDPDAVRRAWDDVAEHYSEFRDPGGEDAALIDELVAKITDNTGIGGRAGSDRKPLVLDVGCGDGRRTLANLVGRVRALGLDVSGRQLELAGDAVPAAILLQGEMGHLPLRENTVDGITAYHAVFHVRRERHPAVYREFARVLRPGGYLLTTVPSSRYETTRRDWLGSGASMFWSAPGRAATRTHLRDAGFEVCWERTVDDPLGSEVPFALVRLADTSSG